MAGKLWKYVYEDAVIQAEYEVGEETIYYNKPEHSPNWSIAIIYDLEAETCNMYSDKMIDGLTMIAQNVPLGGS